MASGASPAPTRTIPDVRLRLALAGFAFASALCVASPARAVAGDTPAPNAPGDTLSDRVIPLPGLEVEEPRPVLDRPLALRPGAADVYDVDSLRTPGLTAADLLAGAVGVHVRRFGGLGAYSAVSVRGTNENQITYYLDGVPLNAAQYGVSSAGDLPLAAVERVEVLRSAPSVRYRDAGGGVVNLVTRTAKRPGARARVSYGGFDTRTVEAWGSAAGSFAAGRVRAFSSYRHHGSRGGFFYLDDDATPFNPDDDEIARRVNNAFTSHALTAKLDWALGAQASPEARAGGAGRLVAAVDLYRKRAGLPGLSAFQAREARYHTDRGVASITWSSPPWLGRALELRTQVHGTTVREIFRDLENELGTGRRHNDDRTRAWGARQEIGVAAGPLAQALHLVGEWGRDEFRSRTLHPTERRGPLSRRETVAFAVEESVEPWAGRLALFAGARLERTFDDFPAGPSFAGALPSPAVRRTHKHWRRQLGVRATLPAGFTARASVSRRHRVPSLFELYGNRGTAVGNRALTPERLDTQDAGLAWSGRLGARAALTLETLAFRTDAEDLILFLQNSQSTSVARNVSAALLQGVESSVSARWRAVSFSANWTLTDTRDRSAAPHWRGRRLPGRPLHEIGARTGIRHGRLRLHHEIEWVAGNFLDRANREPVESRTLHHLGAALVAPGIGAGLHAEIRNLTDDRVRDVAAFPLPGRTWSITAEYRFQP